MGDDSLTHKDLAKALEVSETTIKSYRRKFPGCLPVVVQGKPICFGPQALEVCRAIRQDFIGGLSVEAVRQRLAAAYPWCRARVRESVPAPDAGLAHPPEALAKAWSVLDDLGRAVRDLARTQGLILDRLQGLEGLLAARAGPDRPGPDKIVRIRTRHGGQERYRLSRLGPEPDVLAQAGPSAPLPGFMALPMVIRDKDGFLGIAGRGGHLCLDGFLERMRRKAGEQACPDVVWEPLDNGWVLHLGPAGALVQAHVLSLEQTTTPLGNEVVWLKAMLVDGRAAGGSFLHEFLRTLRQDFD